jgi:DNA-binding winged helix-turn-helix (wHTH) protein/Tol biopolymer transport system component
MEFSAKQMELRKRGHRIRLSASQLRLLILFLERPGELITRDEVIGCLWTNTATIDTISGVNTAINRLRFHLGDDANTPRFLETVIGVGYRFIAPLQYGPSAAPVVISAKPLPELIPPRPVLELSFEPADLAPTPLPTSGTSRRAHWMVAVIVLFAGTAGWLLIRHRQHRALQPAPLALSLSQLTSNYGGQQVTATALSSDGKLLAYADKTGIRVHDLTTSYEYSLGTLPTFAVTGLSWLPGAKQIVVSGTDFNQHRQLVWIVSTQSVDGSVLATDADLASASPNGQLIAIVRSNYQDMTLIRRDGTLARTLAHTVGARVYSSLSWSPDGSLILAISHDLPSVGTTAPEHWMYESIRISDGTVLARQPDSGIRSAVLLADGRLEYVGPSSGGNLVAAGSIFAVQTDVATGRLLGTPAEIGHIDAAGLSALSVSADGSRLAVLALIPTADVFTAMLRRSPHGVPSAFESIQRVTSSNSDAYPHAWRTDGSIIYESAVQGHLAVMAQSPGEILPRVLGQFPFNAAMAQLSPDNRFVLFLHLHADGQQTQSVYRMPVDGGQAQKIADTDGVDEFRCSRSIAMPCVLRRNNGNKERLYYALDPLRGVGQLLAKSPWQAARHGDWDIAPDGSTIAVANHDPANPSVNLLSLSGAATFSRSIPIGGHGSPLGVTWDIDGPYLFVETRNSNSFELLSSTLDGHLQLLRKSTSVIWPVSSPDGKSVAFPDPTRNSNVWVADLLP